MQREFASRSGVKSLMEWYMHASTLAEHDVLAFSDVMKRVLELVDSVATSNCSVLIEGDSGTGKDLIARRLHARSSRANGPFIPVNCAGIGPTLFESQLFGHVRGSFTGAEQTTLGLVRCADKGTLFLDEIGEMSLELQPKLLRVLQENEVMPVGATTVVRVNVRFVAATNRNLRDQVRRGQFREDLFYRLNVVHIYVPPLRARRDDILPLLDVLSESCAKRYGRPVVAIPSAVRERLLRYEWPGNVRELSAWVERAYATQLPVEVLALALELEGAEPPGVGAHPAAQPATLKDGEREMIARALASTGNNRTKAAHLLQIDRGTLIRKIQRYNIAASSAG